MLEKFTESRKDSATSFIREAARNPHIGSEIQDGKIFYLYMIDKLCACLKGEKNPQ